jgi:hypothetical protein
MRSSLSFAIAKLGRIRCAAEIGVKDGRNTEEMIKVCNEVYAIDPYLPYEDGRPITQEEQAIYKMAMFKRLSMCGDRLHVFNTSSSKAAKLFDDEFFDYVYIDGDHSHAAVKADLECWYPKVKQGGILAGHDFDNAHNGVTHSVRQFTNYNKLRLMSAKQDGSGYWDNINLCDWWIIKP